MRYLLAALLFALAVPAVGQVGGGTPSDNVESQTLDLSVVGSTLEVAIGNGQGVVAADITGLTGSGATVMVERTVGGLWTGRNLLVTGSAGAFAPSVSQDASFTLNSVGSRAIRFRVSVAGIGLATVYTSATANSSVIQFGTSLPAGNLTIGKTILPDGAATVALQQQIVTALGTPLQQGAIISVAQSGTWSVGISGTPTFNCANCSGSAPAVQQVADNGGSLTVDTPQLPATLGAKTTAQSLAVTLPNDQAGLPVLDRGSASMLTGQVSVNNTTAVQIVAARTNRRSVLLQPTSQFTYFVGPCTPTLTASNGFPVLNGAAILITFQGAICSIANSTGTMGWMDSY